MERFEWDYSKRVWLKKETSDLDPALSRAWQSAVNRVCAEEVARTVERFATALFRAHGGSFELTRNIHAHALRLDLPAYYSPLDRAAAEWVRGEMGRS